LESQKKEFKDAYFMESQGWFSVFL
jgi:hypothetical protein